MVKTGDVVFFKKVKRGTRKSLPEIAFKGHGFGVLLGHVDPFQKEPPAEHLLRMMGAIGFVSFDDVGELLGDEMGTKMVAAFEKKYYGRTSAEAAAEGAPAPEQVAPPKLVGPDGKPIAFRNDTRVHERVQSTGEEDSQAAPEGDAQGDVQRDETQGLPGGDEGRGENCH